MDCSVPDCSSHHNALDSYGSQLISTLLSSALDCFSTCSVSKSHRRLVGWSHSVTRLKQSSAFWYKIWVEAGCPSSGVLSQIKKSSKTRYKYAVRRLRCRQDALLQNKLANSFARNKKSSFWSDVRRLKSSSHLVSPVVDGVAGSRNIANVFASQLQDVKRE